MNVSRPPAEDSRQTKSDDYDQHISDRCEHLFVTTQRRQHHHGVNKSAREDNPDAESNCYTEAEVADIRIDERAAAEIVDQDQQREAAEPRGGCFPAKPMQRA